MCLALDDRVEPMAELPEIDLPYDSDVYTPAEDTYLFVDALQDELPYISALKPAICAEIGQVKPNKSSVEWSNGIVG